MVSNFHHSRRLPAVSTGARSAGFTLIEVMIVVVIVSILVAVALPAYQVTTASVRWPVVVVRSVIASS